MALIKDSHLSGIQHQGNVTSGEIANHSPLGLQYLQPGALVLRFEGVDSALDYISKKMPTPKRSKSSSTHKREDSSFYTFDTYEEAMGTYRSKPESVAKFNEGELNIKDTNENGNEVQYDVIGDYIDMGRHMEGIPEVFGTLYNGRARNRRINIVVDTNQVFYITAEDVNHRSERILRLVDALETNGARCELVAVDSNECSHVEVVIKKQEESLAINDLAIVTHGDFKRRIIFRVNEYSKTWQAGYGRPNSFQDYIQPSVMQSDNVNEITVLIGGSMEGKKTIDSKFDKLERLLAWELSKSVPEVNAIKVTRRGFWFQDNGVRESSEIQAEGKEAMNDE